jgi:mercuric ion transport protein
MERATRNLAVGAGAIVAATAASLCCVLPLAAATLGVGSAAFGATLAPLRPYLLILTIGLLGFAHYQIHRARACAPGDGCAETGSWRRRRIALWIVTGIAVLLMALPYYVEWLR